MGHACSMVTPSTASEALLTPHSLKPLAVSRKGIRDNVFLPKHLPRRPFYVSKPNHETQIEPLLLSSRDIEN